MNKYTVIAFILGVIVGILTTKYYFRGKQLEFENWQKQEQVKRERLNTKSDSLQQIIDNRDTEIRKLKRDTDSVLRKQKQEYFDKLKSIVRQRSEKIHYVNTIDSAYIGVLASGL